MWPDTITSALEAGARAPLTVDLTTTGRHSAEPRRIEIWIIVVSGDVLIIGTPGRRDWLANMRAAPTCTLHLKGASGAPLVVADIACRVVEINDGERRRAIMNDPVAHWYVGQSSMESMINDAPMVELIAI